MEETEMESSVRTIDKPGGYELFFAHTDKYAGKILHVNAGEALSLQYHEKKDETLYLLQGEYELVIEEGDELVHHSVRPGMVFRVRPGTIIEVSTPELEDVVRLEDRYGRS